MKIEDAVGPGVNAWLIDRLRSWKINKLTDVQMRALNVGIANGCSMIVSAPTSTGKTLVGEIAVLAALKENVRAIYLVSHKALADQKYLDFIERYGEKAAEPIASVGLNTGDRAEGEINAQLLVATYEKALGLILSGQLKPDDAVIVADELQILGEQGRGPEIETLCALFRQRKIRQFVALTATVENPEDLAGWMQCELVQSFQRDVPLHQEIWYSNRIFRTTFGDEEGQELGVEGILPADLIGVAKYLLDSGRGPVLVFTESRREAAEYALAFGKMRPRVGEGIKLAEQLDLFSEPTESSEQLRDNAEKRVTFHSADLTAQERQVIETGFLDAKFEVCFATSTLAAGVNFPFRSIVFPKLTFQWGERAGTHLLRADYRNMSGRAGRLGMHTDGYAVLLPRNTVELSHAKQLVQPTNDQLSSQLVALSLRKTILMLFASRLAASFDGVNAFFRETLYWHQTLDRNPSALKSLQDKSKAAIEWLLVHGLIRDEAGSLVVTQLGNGTALSGLLPVTAVQFVEMLRKFSVEFDRSFEDWIDGLIYAVCASDEFRGERPSRFLPWPMRRSYESVAFWSSKKLPVPLDRADTKLAQCAQAIALYINGIPERKIAHISNMSSGSIHRLALDVAWALDGFHKLVCIPELGCLQTLGNNIAMLARRVRWGVPSEALDVIRVAEKHGVPGFGRQRAMVLLTHGIASLHDILGTAKQKLIEILRNERRAQALLEAAASIVGVGPSRLTATHIRLAKRLGIEGLVDRCNKELGVNYEKAIVELLRVETSWVVKFLDDGTRQNVPDLLVQLGEMNLLMECKTCSKSPPLIKKEEAWAVLQKAADFDKKMPRATLGKPAFDEASKKKAAASHDITLVEHSVFLEGLLRVHAGSLAPAEFLKWMSSPGCAEMERIGGKPTFSV